MTRSRAEHMDWMRLNRHRVFGVLSSLYIACIFILAEVPAHSELIRAFNPYSLAHIPLYGALTILLVETFRPKRQILQPMVIATAVAVLDEINQAFVPGRDASASDVALDIVGITIVLLIARRRYGVGR